MKQNALHKTPIAVEKEIWTLLEEVKDPEVPVLSIVDLGIVRRVEVAALLGPYTTTLTTANDGNGAILEAAPEVRLTITPTYSGCPAMDVISMDIRLKLIEKGYRNITIKQQLSPAWTTDWMTEAGKQKLKAFGIAAPHSKQQFCTDDMFREEAIECPRCSSYHTELISQFSSTACKAMYRCLDCKEAFDYFKCH